MCEGVLCEGVLCEGVLCKGVMCGCVGMCGCAGEGRVKGDNYRVCDVHCMSRKHNV